MNPQVAAARPEVTLRARICSHELGDRELGAQTFRGAGEHVYAAALPAGDAVLGEESVRIKFSFDRAYLPPAPDGRELGAQVTFAKTGPTLRREWTHPFRML